jgi:ketosteroid isomerase-like protein
VRYSASSHGSASAAGSRQARGAILMRGSQRRCDPIQRTATVRSAIAAGDLDRVASFWTDDVTVRRALGQPLSGRAAARQALEPPAAPAARVVYQRQATAFDVSPHWPLAFETGTWEGHSGSVSGPTVIGGRYSAQWVKRDGRWLIRSEVFVALTCAGAGCEAAAVP